MFTTSQASRVVGLHQQTLIKWDGEGFFRPVAPRRKYHPRRYIDIDLVALGVAKTLLAIGLDRGDVKTIARQVQKGELDIDDVAEFAIDDIRREFNLLKEIASNVGGGI
jgi:DNA-binding transcriptional MerR regulator